MFILLAKNLNPFSLQRKISDKFKHEMIYMFWRECIPPAFYRFICQEENFGYLNGWDVSQPGVLEIVGKFVEEDKNNLRLLQQCLANYKDIFQYVYSYTYPEVYTMSEKRGIDVKSNLFILFKTFKDKLLLKQQQQQLENLEVGERKEEFEHEQKPFLKFNEFSEEEEKEIREQQRENNKKRKRQQVVSNEEKIAKLQRKTVENWQKEKEMWEKLDKLKKQFKDIKQHERAEENKMSSTKTRRLYCGLFVDNFTCCQEKFTQYNL